MLFLNLETTDPYYNLAVEEYLMKYKSEPIFMLWSNEKCVVIGKNQNAYKEINFDLVKEHNIKVVRRQSGGGAVFHDIGNFNFTFIYNNAKEDFANFTKFVQPLVELLNELGVNAKVSGRNDILIDECKISGNAQYNYHDRLLHHGTVIYSLEYSDVMKVLNVDEEKIKSKGISSVKSRITNVIEHMPIKLSIEEFKEKLISKIQLKHPELVNYQLTSEDLEIVKQIEEKNNSWEYIYGQNPKFEISHKKYVPNVGMIEVYLNIKKGLIQEIKFFGDFFALKDLSEFEKKFIGVKYNSQDIKTVIDQTENFNQYFHNLDQKILCEIIIKENV